MIAWTLTPGLSPDDRLPERCATTWYPAAALRETKPRPKLARDDVGRVLGGDVAARRRFVTALLPIVHVRVARTLLRRRGADAPARAQVEDFAQDVFEYLFRDEGRRLRQWDPERGMSLENYVGMIAEQRVLAALRTRRHNPWTEEPTCAEHLAAALPPQASPDRDVAARQMLERLVDEVRAQLSPKGRQIFQRLVLEDRSVAEVSVELGMSPSALHAWSSRLRKRLREAMHGLSTEPSREGKAS